jgi:ribosomal protein S18 acetylase RimI-like enzyme
VIDIPGSPAKIRNLTYVGHTGLRRRERVNDMAVTLRQMSAEEFVGRRAELVRDSADSLAAYLGLAVPEAAAQVERATAAALPLGPDTPDHLLRTAVADGAVIGWIWLSLPGTFMPDLAWVSDVAVDPPFRSRGYGRAIMLAGEAELAGRGLTRVGLNVDGRNDRARHLYDRLGYTVTGQQWAREIDAGAGDRSVTLTSDGTAILDGHRVGRVVYTDHHRDRPGQGWISELNYDSPEHGAAILTAVQDDLAGRGARRLGIEVAGTDGARPRLLAGLGFRLIAQQMEKRL